MAWWQNPKEIEMQHTLKIEKESQNGKCKVEKEKNA